MRGRDPLLFFLCLNDRGGAEISMIRIAMGLLASGRSVTLAVYGSDVSLPRSLGFVGEIIDLDRRRTLRTVLPLAQLLRRRKFNVILSALTHTNIAAILASFVSLTPHRIIVTEHSSDGLRMNEKFSFFAFLTGLTYRYATDVVTVSRALSDHWQKRMPFHQRVKTLYNPVVDDKQDETPPPAHAWLSAPNVPVVMAIGRLKPEKDFMLLVEAFAKVLAVRPIKLIILGEGDQRVKIEALIAELDISAHVVMPGFMTKIEEWLPYASLFVSSSRREGFGNAIVEAMSYGVPVVATDCPYGPAEILEDGKFGRLVPVADVNALAAAMQDALNSETDPGRLRARASNFTVVRCIDGYAQLIDNR